MPKSQTKDESSPTTTPHHTLMHRLCEHCGNIISIHPSDISRGKGMFCSKSCAAKRQHYIKYKRNCATCGSIFKTSEESEHYCSEECKGRDLSTEKE